MPSNRELTPRCAISVHFLASKARSAERMTNLRAQSRPRTGVRRLRVHRRPRVYPDPVGMDITCSMNLLQLLAVLNSPTGPPRGLIDVIRERTPTSPGRGQGSARNAHKRR